jgi:hypothetical protein
MKEVSIILAVTCFLILTSCSVVFAAEKPTYVLRVFKESHMIYIAYFSNAADCAITGMEFKTDGVLFQCEIINE